DRCVAYAVEQGVNYFDVAPTYGDAQQKLGRSLVPYRDRVYLACKTAQRRRREAEEDLRRSMELLHTDHFDVYQLHGLSTDEDVDVAFGPGGAAELLRDLREQGIARRIGVTAHNERVALRALSLCDFDTVLFPFNWHMHMAHDMGSRLLAAARERGMGVLCMKSMIERAWDRDERQTSRYPKSWCKPFDTETDARLLLAAVRYAASLGVDVIIPPGNFEHFSFAVEHGREIFDTPLTDEDRALLAERLDRVRDRPFFAVP
ncbi:MAG: aldo/keto reductase, partial [Clostridia bacterium]|nr:aldo/keto reductase [Clostridia bacterium]